MVWPWGKNSLWTIPLTSKKAINTTLTLDLDILAFFDLGDVGLFHSRLCRLVNRSFLKIHWLVTCNCKFGSVSSRVIWGHLPHFLFLPWTFCATRKLDILTLLHLHRLAGVDWEPLLEFFQVGREISSWFVVQCSSCYHSRKHTKYFKGALLFRFLQWFIFLFITS